MEHTCSTIHFSINPLCVFSHSPVRVLIQKPSREKCCVLIQENLSKTTGNLNALYFARIIADVCYLPGVTVNQGLQRPSLKMLYLMLEEIAI